MNLLHLKYAVEVEKTRSINKAAENLYMGQPNLSRAIKELEESLGITIFNRTSKGISLTPQGEEFLGYAKNILAQVSAVEAMYQRDKSARQQFSISIPRASYIAHAFTSFVQTLDDDREMEITFRETNSMNAIHNILQEDYSLGIIRYQAAFEPYFATMLHEKGLQSEELWEFSYVAVMSAQHPLAHKDTLSLADLGRYVEIAHGDPYVPSMPIADVKKAELSDRIDKRIFVFERGSQFDLLSDVHNTYMWVSPIPATLLNRYGLVEKRCDDYDKRYKDVLIYRKEYHFSELDTRFLKLLRQVRQEMDEK